MTMEPRIIETEQYRHHRNGLALAANDYDVDTDEWVRAGLLEKLVEDCENVHSHFVQPDPI